MLSLLRSSSSLATAGVTAPRCFRCFSHSSASYSDITKITISGKLFRAPELSTTSSGRQCIRYTVRSWKGGEKANYFNIMCMTDNAKSIEFITGLPKGTVVVAEGEFSPYQLAQKDGTRVSRYSIFSNNLHVIERGKPDEEVAREEIAGKEIAGKEAAGKEAAGEEAAGEEVAREEVAREEVAHEEVAHEEVAGEEVAHEEVAGEEVAGEEVAGGEVAGGDAQAQAQPAPVPAPAPASAEGGGTPENQAPN